MSSIVPSPPKKVTVASSPAGWLSIAGQALTFALVSATATVAGVVDFAAQTFAGVKTFASTLVASAGIQVGALWNTNGTSASDVGVKVGVSTPDASVNASAKLLSVRTGIGGTEVEHFYALKGGLLVGGNGVLTLSDTIGAQIRYTSSSVTCASGDVWISGNVLRIFGSAQVQTSGRLDQKGTDRASTVGNDTQHAPSGINTIASGATSVTITNNLVPNPATTKVRLNLAWRGDPGSRWWWTQTTGAITINLQSPAPANASFDWEIAGLL